MTLGQWAQYSITKRIRSVNVALPQTP
jgi:hypothetical protein